MRQRIGNALAQKRTANTRWWLSAVAAACLVLIVGATMLFNSKSPISSSPGCECVVYVAGQKTSGVEAQAIAEADVARMEQFMQTVSQQHAAEQEKVNQFIQHKYLEK